MRKVDDGSDNKVPVVAYWDYGMFLAENGEWGIREVFYDKDGTVLGWASYPAALWEDTLEGLAGVLIRMQKAADRPPLVEADFPDGVIAKEQPSLRRESYSESSHPDYGGV
jgi:hypothetical protein